MTVLTLAGHGDQTTLSHRHKIHLKCVCVCVCVHSISLLSKYFLVHYSVHWFLFTWLLFSMFTVISCLGNFLIDVFSNLRLRDIGVHGGLCGLAADLLPRVLHVVVEYYLVGIVIHMWLAVRWRTWGRGRQGSHFHGRGALLFI